MKVYFVRHGESVLNEKNYQFPDTPLSDLGRKQAEAIASRFTHIPIELIITSPYLRTLDTAKEIERLKDVKLIESDLMVERRMPSSFLGKSLDDPETVKVHKIIRENYFKPEWHYGDEENFLDLFSRAKNTLDLIHSHHKENIAVITHGYFLTVMIFYILFGENVEPQTFRYFRDHTSYTNTGITLCEHKNDKWTLLTWNDYAHLGE